MSLFLLQVMGLVRAIPLRLRKGTTVFPRQPTGESTDPRTVSSRELHVQLLGKSRGGLPSFSGFALCHLWLMAYGLWLMRSYGILPQTNTTAHSAAPEWALGAHTGASSAFIWAMWSLIYIPRFYDFPLVAIHYYLHLSCSTALLEETAPNVLEFLQDLSWRTVEIRSDCQLHVIWQLRK